MTGRPLSSPEPRRWCIVAALLLLAALLRVSTSLYHEISGDDATVALMAKHILSGEAFPVFFYRQTYMGSLNGAHLVPALFLFGPSPLLVRLNAVFYSLIFPLGLYLLGRRVFDEATARVALLLAALPPFLLIYWSTVAEPHFETNVFGVVLLLLAVAAIQAQSEPRHVRVMICLGLTAGLAFWTSFKALEVLVPVLLVLICRPPRFPLRRSVASFAGGVFLGGLPAWLFYATHGDPARHTAGSVTGVIEADLTLSPGRFIEIVTTVIPTLLGTYYWHVDTFARLTALLVNIGVYTAATVTVVAGALRPRPQGDASAGHKSGVWLLLLTLAIPFAMLYMSGIASPIDHESARYVLPVYIPLLLLVGAFLAQLWRRSRAAAMALLAFLLTFNLWTNLRFMWPLDPEERARRAEYQVTRRTLAHSIKAHAIKALYVDDRFTSLRWAFELTGIPVSELRDDIYPPNALAADAADRVAILAERHHTSLEQSLTAAGVRFRRQPTPFGWFYTDFALESPQAYLELAPAGWRATASPHPELAPRALDRDAGTRWESRARQPGMWFQVDLGRIHRIGMVAWLPGGVQDVPSGFRLDASPDGRHWTPVREVASYYGPLYWSEDRPLARARWGRVELRFPPLAVRYLRITHRGADPDFWWTIREFFAYEATDPPPEAPADTASLTELLPRTGIRKVYADHGVGARVAEASRGLLTILPANIRVDPYGRLPDPDRLPRFRPRPDVAVVYPQALPSADSIPATLRTAGWEFTLREVGGYHLLTRFVRSELTGTPLTSRHWSVAGSVPGSDPNAVLDGQLNTRWVTPGPETPGAWLRVDLGQPTHLTGLALDLGPFRFDYPRGLALEFSPDGLRWLPVSVTTVLEGPLRWVGTHLLRDGVDRVILRFSPVRARALRLTQTNRDPVFAWSVAELRLWGGGSLESVD